MPLYRLTARSFVHGQLRDGGEIVELQDHEASAHMVLLREDGVEASPWDVAQQKRLADQRALLAEISETTSLPEGSVTVAECENRISALQAVDDAHYEFSPEAVMARRAAIDVLLARRTGLITAEAAAAAAEEERVASENPNLIPTNVFFGRFQAAQLAAIAESPVDHAVESDFRSRRTVDVGDPVVTTWLKGLVSRSLIPESQVAEILKPIEHPASRSSLDGYSRRGEFIQGQGQPFAQPSTVAGGQMRSFPDVVEPPKPVDRPASTRQRLASGETSAAVPGEE